jgi:hypothetical protein
VRAGKSVFTYNACVPTPFYHRSEERLEKDFLSIIPPELLVEYRQEVILENIHLLNTYLHFVST